MIINSRPTPDNDLASYLAKSHDFARQSSVGSSGMSIESGPGGTHVKELEKHKYPHLEYFGEYDRSGSYTINTIVKINEAFTVTKGPTTFDITEGSWICTQNTPVITESDYNLMGDFQYLYPDESIKYDDQCYDPYSGSAYWNQLGGGGTIKYSSYEYSASYSTNNIVHYTGSTIKYYSGSRDEYLYAGTYIAIKSVQALGSRDSGSLQTPYYPMNTSSYWNLISLFPTTMSVCIGSGNERKTYWIEGTEFEPTNCVSRSILL